MKSTFGGRFRQLTNTAAIGFAAVLLGAPQAASASVPTRSAAIAPVEIGPALWVVQDQDTTIFLFGTFHALDSKTNWFSRSVQAAFNSSDELVLETLVPEDPAELHAIVARHILSSEARPGQPVTAADSAPSFVASAGQAMSAGKSMGMSVDQGADAVLRRAANASGKPVGGLESFEFQLRMFGSLPPSPPPSRKEAATLGGFMTDMQSAWKRGDHIGFASLLGSMRSNSPDAYRTLFTNRNANWAEWIADRMSRPGTVFVAVGTGHLVGPDNVQHFLAERGIRSARIT